MKVAEIIATAKAAPKPSQPLLTADDVGDAALLADVLMSE